MQACFQQANFWVHKCCNIICQAQNLWGITNALHKVLQWLYPFFPSLNIILKSLHCLDILDIFQVEKWDREEIVNFWQKWYFPANATLYLVGDFGRSVEECKALIERCFGSVPAVKEDAPLLPYTWGSREPPQTKEGGNPEAPSKQRHEVFLFTQTYAFYSDICSILQFQIPEGNIFSLHAWQETVSTDVSRRVWKNIV